MSRIIKMVDEIKEYYNLNDTLLASDLGIMQQTIRGWRDGRQPTTPNYNKVKKMYEEMKQEAVDESIVQRFEALEEKVEKKPYEVEYPEDIEERYFIDETGAIDYVFIYAKERQKEVFKRGLAFERRAEVEQYDKERILLFKLHKWAEEHNGEWEHDLGSSSCRFFIVLRFSVLDEKGFVLSVEENGYYDPFSKLPYFKTEEIAEQFIKECGDEIKEVLC